MLFNAPWMINWKTGMSTIAPWILTSNCILLVKDNKLTVLNRTSCLYSRGPNTCIDTLINFGSTFLLIRKSFLWFRLSLAFFFGDFTCWNCYSSHASKADMVIFTLDCLKRALTIIRISRFSSYMLIPHTTRIRTPRVTRS